MTQDGQDTLIFFGAIAGIVVLCGLVIGIVGYTVNSIECSARASRMGVPYEYSAFAGCMVQIDNRWWPLASVKVVQ